MSKDYVSEFSGFMNQYLEDNPEVVKAQKVGRNSSWTDKSEAVIPNPLQDKDSSTDS